jgi:hypothetical protein
MPLASEAPRWSARLVAEFDAADKRATALTRSLTLQQLNWKPAPGRWSVGQCLEHLAVTNEVYGAAITSAMTSAPAGSADEITPGWFGRYFIREYVAPAEKPTRHKAPPKIRPVSNVDASILERFLETNRRSRDLVERARHIDVNRVRFKNPFVPLIRFTVGTGLEILAKHELRHLLQAERVRNMPDFPG